MFAEPFWFLSSLPLVIRGLASTLSLEFGFLFTFPFPSPLPLPYLPIFPTVCKKQQTTITKVTLNDCDVVATWPGSSPPPILPLFVWTVSSLQIGTGF